MTHEYSTCRQPPVWCGRVQSHDSHDWKNHLALRCCPGGADVLREIEESNARRAAERKEET